MNSSINAAPADCFIEALAEAREIDEMLRDMTVEQRINLEEVKPFVRVPFTANEAFALTGLPTFRALALRQNESENSSV